MSDCGIYGNKNWQRAVDKASDKPAATGSGEPTPSRINHVTKSDIAQRIIDVVGDRRVPECELKLRVQAYLDTYAALPTSPSSQPTVTLDREVFNKIAALAATAQHKHECKALPVNRGGSAYDNLWEHACDCGKREVMALLRAAEQKPSEETRIITTSLDSQELEANRKEQAEYGRKRGFEKPGEPRL